VYRDGRGYLAFEPSERRRGHYPIFFLLLSTALMIMTARWKRIAEYWPPFAVLFARFSLQPWLEGYRPYLHALPADVLEELKPFLDREGMVRAGEENDTFRDCVQTVLVVIVAVVLSVFLFFNLRATSKRLGRASLTITTCRARWMRTNVPPGKLIFNTDWDDFPRLFYSIRRTTTSPGSIRIISTTRIRTSRVFTNASHSAGRRSGPLIRDRFGARYVFSDNTHHDFFEHARSSGWFDIVYEDTQCTIMYIRDQKIDENRWEALQ
jgi:hypothetical protein